jgi:hypothetical protein
MRKHRIILMSLLILFSLLGCSKATEQKPPQINWILKGDPSVPQQDILNFINLFYSKCLGIQKYATEIETATIAVSKTNNPTVDYLQEKYGWRNEITISIKIKDNARLPSEWRAEGHTLYYIIGGQLNPGIVAKNDQSATFFGMAPDKDNPGSDVFQAVPEFKTIDQL